MINSLEISIPNIGQAVSLSHWQSVPEGYSGLYFITYLKNDKYVPIYVGSTNSLYDRAHEHYQGYLAQERHKYQLWAIVEQYSGTEYQLFFNYFYTYSYYQSEALLLGSVNFPTNSDHNGGFMSAQTLQNEVTTIDPSNNSELEVSEVIAYAEAFSIQNYLD